MRRAAEFEVPSNLVQAAARDSDDGRREWIVRLPDVVAELTERWSLQVGGPFQPGGHTSWTAPARDDQGRDLVLKVGWAHFEAEHEAAGLRTWAGRGTVLVHEEHRVGQTSALLLERARPGAELRALPEPEQDLVLSHLLNRLWVDPEVGHPFRPLLQMCDAWADGYEADPNPELDPGIARAGVALFRSLPREPGQREVLLVTDLHAGNVLSGQREPWLVIDPKPYVGDPAYDPVQHLLNCDGRLFDDPRALVARLAALSEVDEERVLLWLFARCVVESSEWPGIGSLAGRLAPS